MLSLFKETLFHTLDDGVVLKRHKLIVKDASQVLWPALLWTTLGVCLCVSVCGSILSRVPWNPSASSWLTLILIKPLRSVCPSASSSCLPRKANVSHAGPGYAHRLQKWGIVTNGCDPILRPSQLKYSFPNKAHTLDHVDSVSACFPVLAEF